MISSTASRGRQVVSTQIDSALEEMLFGKIKNIADLFKDGNSEALRPECRYLSNLLFHCLMFSGSSVSFGIKIEQYFIYFIVCVYAFFLNTGFNWNAIDELTIL